MADDDLLDQQKALKARVDATRADAAQLREQLGEAFPKGATELGIARDRATKAKVSAERAVEDADAQVTTLTDNTTAYRADLKTTEAAIAAAVAKGDGGSHDTAELRERADGFRNMIQEGDARVHAARLDAAAARETAGSAERAAMEADLAYDEHYDAVTAAERQIDLIEQRADLIEQARMKLVEAEVMYSDPPADADMDKWIGEKATLEVAAEDLVKQAEAIHVDRRIIALVVPTADDPAPPNDDLMDPNEDSPSDNSTPPAEGDALGLDLVEPAAELDGADDGDTGVEAPDTLTTGDPTDDSTDLAEPSDAAPTGSESSVWDGSLDDTFADVTSEVWDGVNSDDGLDTDTGFDNDAGLESGFGDPQDDGASDGFGADGF